MNKTDEIKLGSHMSECAYYELKGNEKVKDRFHNPFFNGFAIEEEMAHYFAFKYGFNEKLVRVVKNVTVYEGWKIRAFLDYISQLLQDNGFEKASKFLDCQFRL